MKYIEKTRQLDSFSRVLPLGHARQWREYKRASQHQTRRTAAQVCTETSSVCEKLSAVKQARRFFGRGNQGSL